MGKHYESFHKDLIPEDMTPNQFAYYTKTGKTHGRCTECGRDTAWNPKTNKYHRLCGRKECRKAVADRADGRNVISHGQAKLLDSREHQEKMLYRRKIAGEYRWSKGDFVFKYVGTYELDFLKFMDLKLNWDPNDLLAPAPQTFEYVLDGKTHFYIPDAFIPSINTFIEIKDGDPSNPNHHANMHPDIVAVNRVKERMKDEVMRSLKGFHYIKIYNKEYDGFMKFLNQQANTITESTNVFEEVIWWKKDLVPLPYNNIEQHRAFKFILKKYRETVLDMLEEWESYVEKNKLQKLTIASKKHNDKLVSVFKNQLVKEHEKLVDDMNSDEFDYYLDESDKTIKPNKSLIPDNLWDFSVRVALIDAKDEIARNNDADIWLDFIGYLKPPMDKLDAAILKSMKEKIPYYVDLKIDDIESSSGMMTAKINLYTLPKEK
jgi:hypothetical protein